MASTIAAITTGIGGIVQTADASGNLSLLSGDTTVVAVTATGATVTGALGVTGVATLGTGAILGTPASGNLSNCTGFPSATALLSGATTIVAATSTGATVTGTLGVTGVATLGTGAILNTPASGNLTNCTGTGGLRSQQVFTAPGTWTWTKPAGISRIKVTVTGGGGGGCATNSDDTTGGGGAGSTAIKIIDVSSISSVQVTVGAGQAAKADNGPLTETFGNPSSFGTFCTAGAGANGSGAWSLGGTGGTATGGDINLVGGDGDGGHIDELLAYVTSGTGGASYWGGGGRGASKNNPGGSQSGRAYGSGGGGGANTILGGSGAPGIVVVEEFA